MFLERLFDDSSAPLLEQTVKFASQRHNLILENLANVSTPDYRQKDLSLDKFQAMLRERIDSRPEGEAANFSDVENAVENPKTGLLFHDRNNRSMEQLESDLAKNALMHNMAIEMLHKQFQTLELALKDK